MSTASQRFALEAQTRGTEMEMDNRIIIHELCIELAEPASSERARRIGRAVSGALAERLKELQARRLEAVLAEERPPTRVIIDRLKLTLQGREEDWPPVGRLAEMLVREVVSKLEHP